MARIPNALEFRIRIYESNGGRTPSASDLRRAGYDLSDEEDRDELMNHLRQLVRDGYAPANGLYGLVMNRVI
jgi:hypothetical protein